MTPLSKPQLKEGPLSLYTREQVAVELEKSKDILAALKCEPEVSHAINILFSHAEHLRDALKDLASRANAHLAK